MEIKKTRTGVILAAGYGSRLHHNNDIYFKPLTSIKGTPLILRVIDSLTSANCNRIVIVLGFGYEQVKSKILELYRGETPLEFVYNDKYELSNGVSTIKASKYIDDEFILTMADHLFDDQMMELAAKSNPPQDGALLLVDYKIDSIFDLDDATKVLEAEHKIKAIGKKLSYYNCVDTGVFIATSALTKALERVFNKKGDVSLSDGVQLLANQKKMEVVDIKDSFWQDVDTPEMLANAENMLINGII